MPCNKPTWFSFRESRVRGKKGNARIRRRSIQGGWEGGTGGVTFARPPLFLSPAEYHRVSQSECNWVTRSPSSPSSKREQAAIREQQIRLSIVVVVVGWRRPSSNAPKSLESQLLLLRNRKRKKYRDLLRAGSLDYIEECERIKKKCQEVVAAPNFLDFFCSSLSLSPFLLFRNVLILAKSSFFLLVLVLLLFHSIQDLSRGNGQKKS